MSVFLANLGARLSAARRLGPARSLVKAARRIPGLDVPALRRWDVLHDPRIGRPGRMREFLDRYEALAARAGWAPLDFAGARVLEIGCGPLGGWGPLAVYRGAAVYMGCDPAVDAAILRSRRFADVYLGPVFADLAAHGPGAGFADAAGFAAAWRERSDYVADGVEALPEAARFDVVLSNSCLEHIQPFAPFVAALAPRLASGARMLHLVDFSNHRDKASPFRPLYDMPPAAYRRRYGPHINLLRPPEMIETFARHGLEVACLPLETRPDRLPQIDIDPAWTERFDLPTLAVRAAVLVGPPPQSGAAS